MGHRDTKLTEPRAEEWLLIEWPEAETEPTKYWFATLPEDIAFDRLVDLTKLRWRIERDYQELKRLPAATVYASFVGIGTAGTAVIGMLWFRESTNLGRICSLILIIIGLIRLGFFSAASD